MHLGTAVALTLPRFEQLFRCCEVTVDMASCSTKLLHDFVQAVAASRRRCRPPIADPWLLPALSFTDSSLNFFPLITFRTRSTTGASNRDCLIGGQTARFLA